LLLLTVLALLIFEQPYRLLLQLLLRAQQRMSSLSAAPDNLLLMPLRQLLQSLLPLLLPRLKCQP
jgi:hypothetical protein